MVVFTVYEPPRVARDPIDRAAELVFVKDNFTWLAAIIPVLWFLVKGLWLELVLFIAGAALLTWGIETAGAASALSSMLLLIAQIVIGFEAGTIQGAALERRGWRLVGTVTGRSQDEAERRFFDAWRPAEAVAYAPEPGAGSVATWTQTAWQKAKDGVAHGRRLIGAKA